MNKPATYKVSGVSFRAPTSGALNNGTTEQATCITGLLKRQPCRRTIQKNADTLTNYQTISLLFLSSFQKK